MSRARQVANFDPALFAADEVSGDKVSGGTIGAGVVGASVTGGAGLSGMTSLGTVATGTWGATDVAVAHGGTGASTHTANNVLIGAGTSAITSVAPGADGNVLTSTGTVWNSEAISAGGLTTFTGYISFAHTLTGDVDQALSFTPTSVIFFATAPFDSQSISWGFCDQNNNNVDTRIKTVDDAIILEDAGYCIWLQGGGGSYSRATCTLGTDKFTLNWSKDGTNAAGTGYVMYMAMK